MDQIRATTFRRKWTAASGWVVGATLAVLGCLGGSTTANAALINVQFGQSNAGFGGPTTNYVGAAVIGTAGDRWNLFTQPFAVAGPFGFGENDRPLRDSGNAATGVTLSYYTPDSMFHANPGIFTGTPYDALMTSFLFADGNRNSPTRDGPGLVSLKGLTPNASYRLLLYSAADAPGRSTVFGVGSVSRIVTPTAATTFIENVNYADLTATADVNGTLTISVGRPLVNGVEGDLNGLQILAVVPEPTTAAATGAVVLVLCRRRRRATADLGHDGMTAACL